MNNFSEEQLHEARLAEYKEVGNNFRTLTEIRFKLLSLLPAGTALVGLFTALGKGDFSKGEISVPLSLFGLAVTLALIVYNERNDQLYDELVARAAKLERLLGLPDGQFSHRPRPWLRIHPIPETSDNEFAVPIEHRWPVETIYRASTIGWLFMLLSPIFDWFRDNVLSDCARDFFLAAPLSTLFALITAFSVGQLFFNSFKAQKRCREESMRKQEREAVERLAALKFSQPQEGDLEAWETIFTRAAELRGGKTKEEFDEEFATVLQWARFYLSHDSMQSMNNKYYPLPPLKSHFLFGATTAAHVIALLTDLPARSLLDVHSGRRGPKEETKDKRKELTEANKTKLIEWLGLIEEIADDERVGPAEQTDRAYWERESDPTSLHIMDKIISSLRNGGIEPKLTYSRHHIAMGATGCNFCWFHPRKTPDHCHMEFRVEAETRDSILSSLQNEGIDASQRRTHNVSFCITTKRLADNSATIIDALKAAAKSSG